MDLEKLKKLVNEMCDACDASGDKPDAKDSPKQAKMARTDLVTIARDAQELVNMFSDETDLPEWVESKITKAADYLNSVRKYIGGEIIRQQDNLMEVTEQPFAAAFSDKEVSYILKNFTNSMSGEQLDVKIERYEVMFGIDYPESIKRIERTLYDNDKDRWASAIRKIYGHEFPSGLMEARYYLNSVRKYIGGEIIRQQDNLMETKSTMPSGSGNPDWNGMSIGLLFGGKFVAIAPNGQALGVFDSREEVVKYIETHMSDYASVKEEYYHISDATYDDGSSVEESIEFWDDVIMEAEYQGRKVTLNKPMQGDVKKSKVYVKNAKGNVVKVNFGDKNMKIKKSNPKRRKSFRARHNCKNPGPKTKARYWSCRAW